MVPRVGVDQLGNNADPISFLAHTTLDDIANTQLLADLSDIAFLPLVSKGRGSRYDRNVGKSREDGDDVIRQSFSQIP